MFQLNNVALLACSSTVVFVIILTFMKNIRSKSIPKLIPAQARNYSMQVQSSTEPDSNEATKLVEWAQRPSLCAHHLGYLEKISRLQSIPNGCFKCYKLVRCLGSWENGNRRIEIANIN